MKVNRLSDQQEFHIHDNKSNWENETKLLVKNSHGCFNPWLNCPIIKSHLSKNSNIQIVLEFQLNISGVKMGLVLFITELAESQRIALPISQSPRVLHYPSVYPANVTIIRCYTPTQISATVFFLLNLVQFQHCQELLSPFLPTNGPLG